MSSARNSEPMLMHVLKTNLLAASKFVYEGAEEEDDEVDLYENECCR
jgi:hypothetical protein